MSGGRGRRLAAGVACLALALTARAPGARAQDAGNPDAFWRASAYLWFANVDGFNYLDDVVVTVGDSTRLYASFAGEVQAGKGRFRGVGRLSTTTLDHRGPIEGPGISDDSEVGYSFTWTAAELLAQWQVGRFASSQALKLAVGLRYVHQGQTLFDGPAPGSVSESWIEPVAGAEYFVEMGGPFWVVVDGDVGGALFGSEFAWRVGAELGVRVAGPVHLSLAYDYLQTEYGDRNSSYRWDEGVGQGWLFGLTVKR